MIIRKADDERETSEVEVHQRYNNGNKDKRKIINDYNDD